VDPLAVSGGIGERVAALLIDLEPRAHSKVPIGHSRQLSNLKYCRQDVTSVAAKDRSGRA
jgi:hypothetical protein